jgi:glycosyltransferase involved in cell wall biosynthesis
VITVLMSVYFREKPEALRQSLESLRSQIVTPAEIIVVKDGPLSSGLESVLSEFGHTLRLRIIELSKNVGLAAALNIGASEATQPWIMRFDSDDVCNPNRVGEQLAWIQKDNLDLFGAQIEEFEDDPQIVLRQRRVPLSHDEIVHFARKRNPFNHMTVCYRRALFNQLGGYPDHPFMEDYSLWLRMISVGARMANSDRVLVRARIGNGMIKRRGGLGYLKSERKLQRLMVHLGMKTPAEAWADGTARSFVFLVPNAMRAVIYRRFLRQAQSNS